MIAPLTCPVDTTIARAITNDCGSFNCYHTGHHHLMGGDAPYQDHQRDFLYYNSVSGRECSISRVRHPPDNGIFINIITYGFV